MYAHMVDAAAKHLRSLQEVSLEERALQERIDAIARPNECGCVRLVTPRTAALQNLQ